LLHGIRADRLNRIFTLDLIQYIRQVSAIILRPGGTCRAFSDGGLFFLKLVGSNLLGAVGGSLVQKMPMTKSPNATFGNAYSAPLHNLYDIHENSIPFLHCDLVVVYFTSLSLLNRETCQTFGYLLIARVIPTSPCLPKRLHYGGRVSHGSAPHGHANL
jgi:hypothetical protein